MASILIIIVINVVVHQCRATEKKKIDGDIETKIMIVLFKLDAICMYVPEYCTNPPRLKRADLSLFASEVQSPGSERYPDDICIKTSARNEL
jgi:hypothetical protein